MDEKLVKKLLESLSYFGNVRFLNSNFKNNEEINFAGIELIATQEIVERLIEEMNSHLPEEAGNPCFLANTTQKFLQKKKYKHIIEIIPYPSISPENYSEVTEETLKKLPHLIKNYRLKNKGRK